MENWLVCYDIPDDKRRTRTASILDDFGDRVQWSVFEVFVTEHELEMLLKRLENVINKEEDSVRFYPSCKACSSKAMTLGVTKKAWEREDVIII